jgi:hypothetical protein
VLFFWLWAAALASIGPTGGAHAEASWSELTRGENVALRSAITTNPPPHFPAAGSRQLRSLNDGVVTVTPDQMFSSDFAVHWRGMRHVFVRFDMHRAARIERVALRVLGGRSKRHLTFPREISAWLSTDGSAWTRVGEASIERDLPAERGEPRVANVALPAYGVAARYVLLHFKLSAEFLYVDEVAIIRQAAASQVSGAPPFAGAPLQEGIVAFPDKGEIVVSEPPLPNFLTILRDGARRPPGALTAWFDLPEGVTLRGGVDVGRAPGFQNRTRVGIELAYRAATQTQASRALFFEAKDTIPAGSSVRITPVAPSGRAIEVPLRQIQIPPVRAPRTLHVSLGWLQQEVAAEFPDLVGTLRALGFNAVAAFPRYWRGGAPGPEEARWLAEARASGMELIYNESPFHVMERRHRAEPEIRTQRPDGRKGPGVSPCYRGRFYAEELARIEGHARTLRPQWVFFDSELWTEGAREAGLDVACLRLRRPNQTEAATLSLAAGEIARDLTRAIARAMPGEPVREGLYAVEPTHRYQGLFDFQAVASNGIDLAMPSLYTAGDPQAVRDSLLAIQLKRPSPEVLPWLTAGTQGEFAPRYLRATVLEAFFAGIRGITYFQAEDFDTPEDFLAHAQAIAIVSRFEPFFTEGSRAPGVRLNAGDATLSARSLGERLLVLVGSYRSRVAEQIVVQTPCGVPWRDVEANTEHGRRRLSVALQPGESRVFECAMVSR